MNHRRRPVNSTTATINVIIFFLHLNIISIAVVAAFSASSQNYHHRQPPTVATTTITMLTRRTPQEVQLEIKDPVDPTAFVQAKAILDELKSASSSSSSSSTSASQSTTTTSCSPDALLCIAKRLGDIPPEHDTYIVSASRCQEAFESLSNDEKKSLLNIHNRVKLFAEAQRRSVVDMEVNIPGGKAGQSVSPCRGALYYLFITSYLYMFYFECASI